MSRSINGSCLCGSVRFRLDAPIRDVVACHCTQCRKTSGHHAAFTAVPKEALTLLSDEGLTWYRSSDTARRGFCSTCGSNLFWDPDQEPHISIAAGTIDGPTGKEIAKHLFTDTKGDYYEI